MTWFQFSIRDNSLFESTVKISFSRFVFEIDTIKSD